MLHYAADEAYSHYLDADYPRPYARADAEAFVARQVLADWAPNPHFAIEHEGAPVGGIELRIGAADPGAGELGYALATALWGGGLMTEAVRAVVDYGFAACGLRRVVAEADVRNVGSWRVMERAGLRREALLPAHRVLRHGEHADIVRYAQSREQWAAGR